MISTEYLRKIFDYTNGQLIWKETRGPAKKGSIAGTLNSRGYVHIRVDNKFYQAHRLVWIWFGNRLISGLQIDHINRDRSDNRIENLRQVSPSDNYRNSEKSEGQNVGVWLVGSKYGAYYNKNGKRYYIGRFDTVEKAVSARAEFIKGLEA